MHSDDVVISVRNVSKVYRLFNHPGDRVKQFVTFGMKKYHREFTALQDVSFDVRRGETVGVIGRNGAGKSTLLQIICGILKPTHGSVVVRGRIAALLELGAGFNPEFTGCENVYFQGSLMGFSSREMDERFAEIAAFAEIGEFIDQPVRMYSSGMFVRLAFSVAVHLDPEILIVDEALGVGDMAFQAKCLRKVDQIRRAGGAVVLVSHSMELIAHHCDSALVLENGRLSFAGAVADALAGYLAASNAQTPSASGAVGPRDDVPDRISSHDAYNPRELRWGDRRATIEGIDIEQCGLSDPLTLVPGQSVSVWLTVAFHSTLRSPIYGISLKSTAGDIVFSVNSEQLSGRDGSERKPGDVEMVGFRFDPYVEPGKYTLSVGVVSAGESVPVPHDRRYDLLILEFRAPFDPRVGAVGNVAFLQR